MGGTGRRGSEPELDRLEGIATDLGNLDDADADWRILDRRNERTDHLAQRHQAETLRGWSC